VQALTRLCRLLLLLLLRAIDFHWTLRHRESRGSALRQGTMNSAVD